MVVKTVTSAGRETIYQCDSVESERLSDRLQLQIHTHNSSRKQLTIDLPQDAEVAYIQSDTGATISIKRWKEKDCADKVDKPEFRG